MKKLILTVMILALFVVPVSAETTSKGQYSVPSSQAFEDFLNEQDYITHDHSIPKVPKIQKTAGLDLTIYSNDTIDLVNENRFNFTTKVGTFGTVLKVKKSLFSLIKGLFNK